MLCGAKTLPSPKEQVAVQIVVLRIERVWPKHDKEWLLDRGTYCFEIGFSIWGTKIWIVSLYNRYLKVNYNTNDRIVQYETR